MTRRDATRPLNQAETDVARGAWRRTRRPGIKYVDAGRLPDGTVELLGTDPEALDDVAQTLCTPGVPVQRTQLPHPTVRDMASIFERPLMPAATVGIAAPSAPPSRLAEYVAGGLLLGGLALLIFGGSRDDDAVEVTAAPVPRQLAPTPTFGEQVASLYTAPVAPVLVVAPPPPALPAEPAPAPRRRGRKP